jgi:hypothetical protein
MGAQRLESCEVKDSCCFVWFAFQKEVRGANHEVADVRGSAWRGELVRDKGR